jgi:PPOX class probable F420-dependent enzyme
MASLTPEQRKLFEEKNFAFIATLNKDGSPQVTPTWVDTDGKNILINTANTRQKFPNVKRDPRVSVSLIDQTDPYKAIFVKGKVVSIQQGDVAENHIDKMAKKYLGQDKYPYRQPDEKRILLTIEPSKVVTR